MTLLLTGFLLVGFLLLTTTSSSSSSSSSFPKPAFANALDDIDNANPKQHSHLHHNNNKQQRQQQQQQRQKQQQQQQQPPQQQQQRLDDEFSPPRHMQTHPLLQIPCGLSIEMTSSSNSFMPPVTPVAAFVDTGAQVSVLSYQAVQKSGLIPLLDRRYAGHALGVGHCRVLGRIPAGAVVLQIHGHRIAAPSLTILESTNEGVDLLLGLDFLRDYQATLSLREEEMVITVQNQDIQVPFIRPRATLSFGDNNSNNKDNDNNGDDPETTRQLCENSDVDGTNTDLDDGALDMSGV